MSNLKPAAVLASAIAIAAGGCGDDHKTSGASDRGLPQGSEPSNVKPADFSTTIDNPYLPMKPGDRWVYEETDTDGAKERVVLTVTGQTKRIANGVVARVAREVVSDAGEPVEITHDWFAQDKDGNVWYFGNATRTYENGKLVDRDGFEAGVSGAEAGVVMPADPEAGLAYRTEYDEGSSEDRAEIVTVGKEQAQTPGGFFKKLVMTRETARPEPRLQEFKLYARGVGVVLTMNTNQPGSRAALLKYTPAE
jgi:hypothetical protein